MGAFAPLAASAAASFLASKIGGGGGRVTSPLSGAQRQINALVDEARAEARRSEQIDAGGLRSQRTGGALTVAPSPTRRGLVRGVQGALGEHSAGLRGLRSQVTPGFGRLTRAAVDTLRGAETRAIGDISDTLGRRRVLGSSFGADALSRTRSEFAQKENLLREEAFLSELQLTADLLNQQSQVDQQGFLTELNELNLETNVALELSGRASQAFSNLAGIQAQALTNIANASTQARGELEGGKGKFLGTLLSIGSSFIGGGGGSIGSVGIGGTAPVGNALFNNIGT